MTQPTRKQFILSETGRSFEGAQKRTLGRFELHSSPDLPVVEVTYDAEPALLLGWPVHRAERLDERTAGEMGGSWLLLTATRVIPDPLGTFASVFSADLEAVASTSAMFDDVELVERASLNAALDLPNSNNWYPFGLTPFQNVTRLQSNHELDLASWTVARVERRRADLSPADAIAVIADNIRETLRAVTASTPVMLGTTAGNETRMMLAGLRDGGDVWTFTFSGPSDTDVRAAAALARLTGFEHEVIGGRSDEVEAARWFEDTGRCVAGLAMKNAGKKKDLPADRAFVKGMGGEIARGYYYEPGDTATTTLTPDLIVDRLHLPAHPELSAAAAVWVDRLQPRYAFELLDHLYADNRVACWQAPQSHADTAQHSFVFPLNKRSTVDAMHALPVEIKRADRIGRLVVQRLWPELLRVPINRPLGVLGIPRRVAVGLVRLARRARARVRAARG